MSTLGQLVDRAYREYLSLPDDTPTSVPLNGAIDDTTTTVVLGAFAIPEEEALVGAGVVLEVGTELMRVTAYNDANNNATVIRGALGTTAAAHSDGDLAYLAPAYARQTVIEHIADSIEDLYPRLYAVINKTIWTDDVVEITDTDATEFISCRGLVAGEWVELHPEIVTDFDEVTSTVAALFHAEERGYEAKITLRGAFPRVSDEATDLSTIGVRSEWEDIVLLGAVGALLSGRELNVTTTDYLTEVLEAQSVPIGQTTNVATAMLRFREAKLREAARGQRARRRPPVRMKKAVPWQ